MISSKELWNFSVNNTSRAAVVVESCAYFCIVAFFFDRVNIICSRRIFFNCKIQTMSAGMILFKKYTISLTQKIYLFLLTVYRFSFLLYRFVVCSLESKPIFFFSKMVESTWNGFKRQTKAKRKTPVLKATPPFNDSVLCTAIHR